MSKRTIKIRDPSSFMLRIGAPNNNDVSGRSSISKDKKISEIYHLEIKKLIPFKNQVRKTFDLNSISSLASTIKEHGIRQPLTVVKSQLEKGKYEVISGERRLKAAVEIGLSSVPCQICFDYEKAEEIALIENVQREDLHPIELGFGYIGLMKKLKLTQSGVSKKIGVPRTQVSEFCCFASFPKDISQKIIEKKIKSRDLLRKVARCRDRDSMVSLLEGVYVEKKKGVKKESKTNKIVLNVVLLNNVLRVQKENVSLLGFDEKSKLKKILKNLINELDN